MHTAPLTKLNFEPSIQSAALRNRLLDRADREPFPDSAELRSKIERGVIRRQIDVPRAAFAGVVSLIAKKSKQPVPNKIRLVPNESGLVIFEREDHLGIPQRHISFHPS